MQLHMMYMTIANPFTCSYMMYMMCMTFVNVHYLHSLQLAAQVAPVPILVSLCL